MRTLWNLIAVLAVANLVALGGFVGWLVATERLDAERLERLRSVLMDPVGSEGAAAASSGAEVLVAGRPADAETLLAEIDRREEIRSRNAELDRERRRRHQEALEAALAEVAAEREAFEAERDAFEQRRREIVELEGSVQFEKTVRIYNSVKAEDAVRMFQERIAEDGRESIVPYLNAMKAANTTKVITEFARRDPALAADLLERLKTYGLGDSEQEGAAE